MKGTVLWRYRVVLTSGVLMIISLHLVSTGRPGDLSSRPASALFEVLRPFQMGLARLGEGSTAIVNDYLELVHAREENVRLRVELAKVSADRARLAELEIENRHLSELLELRDALGVDAVAANVIGSDANGLARTVVLGQGAGDGLKPGMVVLSIQGVVGKIIATSEHASRVLLIDDHNSALDAFDQRSRSRGLIAGLVDDGIIMRYVDRSQDIRDGDPIVTSGLDGIFPRGLLVGTVKSVGRTGPGLFLAVTVAPAVDFRSLEQVMVVRQMPPQVEQPSSAAKKG